MNKLLITSILMLSTVAAKAGELAYVAPEVTMLEEPAMLAGPGAWLIPLIVIAILALTLSKDDCRRVVRASAVPIPEGCNF